MQELETPESATTPAESGPKEERRAISSTEFGTAMAHFYRGEISRANIWRQRLDATFNWAVLTTGTTLSFAFGTESSPHVVILINSMLIVVFLFIEARRYRYYEVWSSRVRVIETDYLAPILSPKVRAVVPRDVWAEHLAEDLMRPHFTVGLWESVGRRLRRNYMWVFMLLTMAWTVKVAIHPTPVRNFGEFLHRASIGALSGPIVVAIVAIYMALLWMISFSTMARHRDSTEVSTGGLERSMPPPRERKRKKRHPDPDMTATFEPVMPRSTRATATLKPRSPKD